MEEVSSASTPLPNVEQVNVDPSEEQPPNEQPSIAPKATKRAAASTSMSQQTKKGKNQRKPSWCWDHFERIEKGGLKRAECIYCKTNVCGNSRDGTSVMSNHLKRCFEYPLSEKKRDAGQMTINFKADKVGGESSICDNEVGEKKGNFELWKFKQEDTRLALAKIIMMDEMTFRSVEREGFRYFMSVAQPHFAIPSRWTVARDCYSVFREEKKNLKQYFRKMSSRICLTTDTWTSCQNMGYMVLTAHFIDDNWRLHKKISSFCQIVGHSGREIGKAVETCLLDWGITTKVLTITVDNTSSNDVGIQYLKNRLNRWEGAVLGGKFLHMRCAAHILSLTVRKGLKETDASILRVRSAVRFVRSSPARSLKFNGCAAKEKIESKRLLCLDVETRWNSTFLMLETFLVYRKAFHELPENDGGKFQCELQKNHGVPKTEDWDRVSALLPFLKIFYDATLRHSGSLYATTNCYLQELVGIGMMISRKCESRDPQVRSMAFGMKRKHGKYWENVDNINLLLYVVVILDPRRKLRYVKWAIHEQYDYQKANTFYENIVEILNDLYKSYPDFTPIVVPNAAEMVDITHSDCEDADDWLQMVENKFVRDTSTLGEVEKRTDLQKYLDDEPETCASKHFDVLGWWKKREESYLGLVHMVRDVLAIPVSTVASESAFSTSGRVLDPFRSSLSSKMVEALVCGQDWLRSANRPIELEESLEEIVSKENEFGEEPSNVDDYY